MGFGQLQSNGQYGAFVQYVNDMAAQIRNAGMRPMAFNDGIYYNGDTGSGTFDSDILIAYWSSGWSGYNVASASFLAGQGFDLVNTNGDYYWIVGKDSCTAEKRQALISTALWEKALPWRLREPCSASGAITRRI